jgi:hypothetical protein
LTSAGLETSVFRLYRDTYSVDDGIDADADFVSSGDVGADDGIDADADFVSSGDVGAPSFFFGKI